MNRDEMSHRMCARCKNVVNNYWNKDYCPECKSDEWASPLDHNNEWDMIHDLQLENSLLKALLAKEEDNEEG